MIAPDRASSAEATLIRVDRLRKTYRELVAVDALSFSLRRGQILGLLGPNGAGKTTTIRLLAGIIRPTSGTVCVDGHDLEREALAVKRRIGYIPDDPRLFETLTVDEHLRFIGSAYGMRSIEPSASHWLERFDLLDKRDALAHSLSRGMRQKLAIACAYLHQPSVLLFDEPLTGLDPKGIRLVQHSIREQAEAGAAVIISSHLLRLVEELCTDLLVLHEGRLRAFGPLSELLRASDRDASLEEVFFAITAADPEPNEDRSR